MPQLREVTVVPHERDVSNKCKELGPTPNAAKLLIIRCASISLALAT